MSSLGQWASPGGFAASPSHTLAALAHADLTWNSDLHHGACWVRPSSRQPRVWVQTGLAETSATKGGGCRRGQQGRGPGWTTGGQGRELQKVASREWPAVRLVVLAAPLTPSLFLGLPSRVQGRVLLGLPRLQAGCQLVCRRLRYGSSQPMVVAEFSSSWPQDRPCFFDGCWLRTTLNSCRFLPQVCPQGQRDSISLMFSTSDLENLLLRVA